MTQNQWDFFCSFRREFQQQCYKWNKDFASVLTSLQKEAFQKDTPEYPIENTVVYNHSLDDVSKDSQIKLIVIGDNPGKDEQRNCNQRYLVGQAGKIAAGFFTRNPELGIDFRQHSLILNKTPVHTAKTAHLRYLLKHGSPEIHQLIRKSQVWMAQKTATLHQVFAREDKDCQLWLVGYAELKGKGLFLEYRDELLASYAGNNTAWNQVMVYQHFSMNRFTIDLSDVLKAGKINSQLSLKEQLTALGQIHRKEIFGV